MSTPASFTYLLSFPRTFSDVSCFSYGMLIICREVLWLYCLSHLTKCSRFLYFSWRAILLSQCIHMLLKQTDSQTELLYLFQFFLNNLPYFIFENLPQVRFYLLNKGYFEFLDSFFKSSIEFIGASHFEIKIKLTDINYNSWYKQQTGIVTTSLKS